MYLSLISVKAIGYIRTLLWAVDITPERAIDKFKMRADAGSWARELNKLQRF